MERLFGFKGQPVGRGGVGEFAGVVERRPQRVGVEGLEQGALGDKLSLCAPDQLGFVDAKDAESAQRNQEHHQVDQHKNRADARFFIRRFHRARSRPSL